MLILQWFPTLLFLEPFLWLYFLLHEPVLLPSHGHGYRSVAPYPMFLADHPLVASEYLGASLLLQDLVLSPLHAIVFMFLDSVSHLPQPGSSSLFSILMQHALIL